MNVYIYIINSIAMEGNRRKFVKRDFMAIAGSTKFPMRYRGLQLEMTCDVLIKLQVKNVPCIDHDFSLNSLREAAFDEEHSFFGSERNRCELFKPIKFWQGSEEANTPSWVIYKQNVLLNKVSSQHTSYRCFMCARVLAKILNRDGKLGKVLSFYSNFCLNQLRSRNSPPRGYYVCGANFRELQHPGNLLIQNRAVSSCVHYEVGRHQYSASPSQTYGINDALLDIFEGIQGGLWSGSRRRLLLGCPTRIRPLCMEDGGTCGETKCTNQEKQKASDQSEDIWNAAAHVFYAYNLPPAT